MSYKENEVIKEALRLLLAIEHHLKYPKREKIEYIESLITKFKEEVNKWHYLIKYK